MIKKISESSLENNFDGVFEDISSNKVTYILYDELSGKDKIVILPYDEYEKMRDICTTMS